MEIWIAAASLIGLVSFALLRTLSRAGPEPAITGGDAAFYHSQIAEIERQAKAGMLGAPEAEAARAEAARRLIAAHSAQRAPAAAAPGRRNGAALAVLVALPALSLPAYLRYGSPALPAQPLAQRQQQSPETLDIANAIARIEAHLAKNPENGQGHAVVAPVYMKTGRFADAARAFEAALRLAGETAARQADLGEAVMFREQGVVTQAAKAAFARALALDARQQKARYYLGLAASQDANAAEALSYWKPLLDEASEPALRERLTAEITRLESLPAGGAAIAALPEADRNAAIRGMVERLEQRLAAEGGQADEWLRLVRALGVLGQRGRAEAALQRAGAALKEDAAALAQLQAAAIELGLPQSLPGPASPGTAIPGTAKP